MLTIPTGLRGACVHVYVAWVCRCVGAEVWRWGGWVGGAAAWIGVKTVRRANTSPKT